MLVAAAVQGFACAVHLSENINQVGDQMNIRFPGPAY
jgi:hypothetical protein